MQKMRGCDKAHQRSLDELFVLFPSGLGGYVYSVVETLVV